MVVTAMERVPRCERCDEPVWRDARADARYCSDACRQAAYRARRKPEAPPDIVDKWFRWYPLDVREVLLAGEDPAGWNRWLVTEIENGNVHLRGGPDGWYLRRCSLGRFMSEAVVDA